MVNIAAANLRSDSALSSDCLHAPDRAVVSHGCASMQGRTLTLVQRLEVGAVAHPVGFPTPTARFRDIARFNPVADG